MKKDAGQRISLVNAWAFPIALLVGSAVGIVLLAISPPLPFSGIKANKTVEAETDLPYGWPQPEPKLPTHRADTRPGALKVKIDALQAEIESLQTLLLTDFKRTSSAISVGRRKILDHQLARLSVATEDLRAIQTDFEQETPSPPAHVAEVPQADGKANVPSPSPSLLSPSSRSGIILLAISCIGAVLTLVRRIADTIDKPVNHFVEIALAITHGSPKQRASVESAGHFRPLAQAFNQMIEARQQAEARLRQAHDSLEFKVQARTVELFRSNKALLEESQQRAQAERDFQQAQKMEALGKLAGSIAHDFNNLLGVIIGGAECAQKHLASEHPALPLLHTVQQAGERAAALTRPLLTFSRSQGLTMEDVDLNAAAEEASRMLQRLVGINVELRLDLAAGLPAVQANGNQIQQVIMNLAVNARDAMNGTGLLTIITRSATVDETTRERAGVRAAEHWVELAVADTGTGMDEATKARIFEPFFTTKPAGRGTGLGLATVFGIVKQSNGVLAVESVLGEGSTFRVYLPAAAPVAPVALPVLSIVSDKTPRIPGHETILLVDDEDDLRELATITLEGEGYRVLPASNAEEAISIAEHHQGEIRALVTDVVMPGITGVELAGMLLKTIPNLRILFVSGYNNESIPTDTRLAAHSDYLQKPYRGHVLAAKVHEILTAERLRASSSWSADDLAEAV